jgi:hypothetical protein
MSHPKAPLPVKPVMSLILAREDLAPAVMASLAEYFGPPDLVGPWWPFTASEYYAPEMGPDLRRRLVSFLHLAAPGRLAAWKVFTNGIEERFTLGGRRTVNLDPGYVAQERLVLATGKNYTHRLYLDQGIFGDLTLIYSKKDFQPLPWSYPDYAQGELPALLGLVRQKYLWQLKELTGK